MSVPRVLLTGASGFVGRQTIGPLLDLAYEEDSRAEVDMNVVMTGGGKFVEVQATAEGQPFAGAQLQDLLALAATGIRRVTESQSTLVQTDFRVRAK